MAFPRDFSCFIISYLPKNNGSWGCDPISALARIIMKLLMESDIKFYDSVSYRHKGKNAICYDQGRYRHGLFDNICAPTGNLIEGLGKDMGCG
jgi:hypothetical protein